MYDDDVFYDPLRVLNETSLDFELLSHFITMENLSKNLHESLAYINCQYIKTSEVEQKYLCNMTILTSTYGLTTWSS